MTYVPTCRTCGKAETVTSSCRNCYDPPVFTMLGGTRMLAKSLLVHYGVDPDQHLDVVAQLDDEIGEELLMMARDALNERGLMPDLDTV